MWSRPPDGATVARTVAETRQCGQGVRMTSTGKASPPVRARHDRSTEITA